MAIEVVLDGDADLALGGLISDEGMPQQLLRVRPLVVVLHQHRFDEAVELLRPVIEANGCHTFR